MSSLDPLILARAQFGLNIAFHILFPTISMSLAWFLVFFRWRHLRTGDPAWLDAYRQWVKIFALTFAMGVVSGIVMSFQFGTNWPGFMAKVGNIAGPLLGYEVMTAFFLEATFLGVMLFGMNRVPGWMHLTAASLVAGGTTLSAFWILALNSWMHTPAGHVIADGVWIAQDWWAVIFNPSFPYRFTHMMLASTLTASFLIAGLSAWRLLKSPADAVAWRTLATGIAVAALAAPLQIAVGDMHGLNTLKHQPAKIAAIEGLWQTEKGAPLVLFAWPDETARKNLFAIEIPKAASLILTHDSDGEIKGLSEFGADIPPVKSLFFGFRLMVGIGSAMLLLAWLGAWMLWRRGSLPVLMLRAFAAFSFAGWVATLAGWIVTEQGRQPWLVSGLLRTAEAAGPAPAGALLVSLIAYAVTYTGLIIAYMVVLTTLAGKGAGAATAAMQDRLPKYGLAGANP